MKQITLKYGNASVSIDQYRRLDKLDISEPEFTADKETFQDSFAHLLINKKNDFSNIGIVIADKTRVCGYDLYLSWMLETLHKLDIRKEQITFFIAYGTHSRQTDEESLNSYGEVYKHYHFVHHNGKDEKSLKEIGPTDRGTLVKINRELLSSSLIITFGAISHHYFAGFGGGRKLLFPGLAATDSIYSNHKLFLDFENQRLQTGCQPGKLEGNPLAEDLKEIDSMLPPKLSIHGILNSKGHVCQFRFGSSYQDFLDACSIHDSYYKSKKNKLYDLVIASAGGYPKDINFIQTHKSMHNAAAFVRDGGTLILLAECSDGIGTNMFLPFFEESNIGKLYQGLEKKYEGNGGTALATMEKVARIKILMVTALPEDTTSKMGIQQTNIEQVQNLIEKEDGEIALIPNASMLIRG